MNKLKVLYVDDEPINLILFKANLEDKYDVLTAENGFEGLKFISENSDLKVVVSDMKMPNMNGIEFIKKAVNISPRIHYYILTGFEITNEIQEALDVGLIRRYFRKPFNMNDISSEIENASERRES